MRLLLEFTGARGGYLFAVRGGRLDTAPHLERSPVMVGLIEWLEHYLKQTLEAIEVVTDRQPDSSVTASDREQWTDATGRCYEPLLLFAPGRDGARTPIVLAALYYEGDSRQVPPRDVLDAIADAVANGEHVSDPDRTQMDAAPSGQTAASGNLTP